MQTPSENNGAICDHSSLHVIDGHQQQQQENTDNSTNMDYEGQKLAELIFYWIILLFGSVGWVIGYFQQDFTVVFQAWLVGLVLSVIVR